MTKPRIALIGTGGTIGSLGRGPFDIADYATLGNVMDADQLLAYWPQVHEVADVVAVKYAAVPSTALGPKHWLELVLLCDRVVAEIPGLDGIVITHGTATLEETAYFLSLTVKVEVPVVVVGAQRPSSGLSSDAGMNLANACRVAGDPRARGLGALVLLNDEIHAAREVTKTSTSRLQTFRSPDFGCLGHADADAIAWYRRPLRKLGRETEFDVRKLSQLPRVDIVYCYAGADGAAVEAFRAAGADGMVSAGFAPSFVTPALGEAMIAAIAAGTPIAASTRAGSGRMFYTTRMREAGFLNADNLNPQKARILLMLGLTVTRDPAELNRMFAEY
ncbi:asparaginase [Sediminicoccus sp. KRV36]|uniref:asparaginase n=1 Tax=Sediminicoccus sp. KRV36 TaxID=3133721 RepID=UPI00200F9EC0|nr:asparaginase [Sediminicoccus rosea]UPY37133.1 asparaginase [Sediminicoccus rosea]